ncbi:head completion/stabilization protein [Chitinimonas sp. PSY-7]|uniref:head completion/stabilization protein n=1 Tax=Chitinimonas sp. PSY-7 TaxID=3459088 RepID=UPI00403FEE55
MSKTFIALGESKPTATDTGDEIINTPFFPSIRLSEVREVQRLDSTVTPPRLRHAVVEAMASANAELAVWADQQKSRGHMSLAVVPVDAIGGESIYAMRYRRAVYCFAAANLIERLRHFDSTKSGHEEADALEHNIGELLRDARHALNDIMGKSRCTVALL